MASQQPLPKTHSEQMTSSSTERLPADHHNERYYETTKEADESIEELPGKPKSGYIALEPNNTSTARDQEYERRNRIFFIVADLLLAITPVFFMFLAVQGIMLHKQPTADNKFGTHVEAATKVSPTIFPIVFAAITARSLRIYARFQAERGARLGLLQTLMGSRSVFAAIETQFLIRKLAFAGTMVLILWLLSPIGAQASLRLLSRGQRDSTTSSQYRYLDTGPAAGTWPYSAFGGSGTVYEFYDNAVLSASILSPDSAKLSPMDGWKNVKIPRVDAFQTSGGWTTVPANITSVQDYTSLMGIPIVGLSNGVSATLNIESSYMDLDCSSPVESVTDDEFWNRTIGVVWDHNPLAVSDDANKGHTMFMDTNLPFDNDARLRAYFGLDLSDEDASSSLLGLNRYVVFGSVSGTNVSLTDLSVVTTNCSISSKHVESSVQCNSTDCAVTKMRPSTNDKRQSTFSPLDLSTFGSIFMQLLSGSGGSLGQDLSSPVEVFLNDTSLTPFNTAIFQNFVDLTKVSATDLSKRLTIMTNTYFQILTTPGAFTGNRDPNLSIYGPDTTPIGMIDTWFGSNATVKDILTALDNSFDDPDLLPLLPGRAAQYRTAPFIAASANGTRTESSEVFVCDSRWAAVLLISSLALLGLGASAAILNSLLVAPDILGYVSSMTYNDPHLPVTENELPMSGMERARQLRDMRVRIGDVRAGQDVGQLAFTAAQSSMPLKRYRAYEPVG